MESLDSYRKFHFEHHRFLLDPLKDPEVEAYRQQSYEFKPMNWQHLLKNSILDLTGWHWIQFRWHGLIRAEAFRPGSIAERWGLTLATILIMLIYTAGLMSAFGRYWILPQMTLLFFLGKVQGYGEHGPRGGTIEQSTYIHKQFLFVRCIIWPLNADCHCIHHRNPKIPWYRLRTNALEYGAEDSHSKNSLDGLIWGTNPLLKQVLVTNPKRGRSSSMFFSQPID
jgi:fatty acid desaturase